MENRDVAKILRETAQLLEIDGAFIARYRSYEKAAELIESLPEPIAEIAKDTERLKSYPGIGERLAEHIQEILKESYALRPNCEELAPKCQRLPWEKNENEKI